MGRILSEYAGRIAVTDGSWGTQLQARGLPAGTCPDAWNALNPSAVEAVAAGYVAAGSEIILTNTFRSTRLALADSGLAERAGELAETGAAISRRAAGDAVKVFGSMGPTGKIVMMGDVPPEQIRSGYAAQAAALARGGADAILCESFTQLDEAVIAARAAVESTELPVLVSMTFDSGPDSTASMMGNTPADLAAAADEIGLAAVGANCGAGPENFARLAELFSRASDLPIWIKPNAGLPTVRAGQTVFPMGPEDFAAFVPALAAAGANFLGGCCGTGPDHLRALRRAVDAL